MILLVGTADEDLFQKAKGYSADPILVTEENWQTASTSHDFGYTGIGEFKNHLTFLNLLLCVDSIIYSPINNNKNSNLSFTAETVKEQVEYLLLLANQSVPVTNLISNLSGIDVATKNSKVFLNLADLRKVNDPQLWAVGCSYTYGIGVGSSERFPTLLSNQLNIPISHLSLPGSSISWAADQILRSDIRKNDIIIWGLTAKERLNWVWQEGILNITIQDYNRYKQLEKIIPKKILVNEENAQYQSLTHIHQVINYCEKIQAKLLIVGLLTAPNDLLYLHDLSNFYQYYNKDSFSYIDFGSDNLHPGPLQHQDYANKIIEQLQLRNWISA